MVSEAVPEPLMTDPDAVVPSVTTTLFFSHSIDVGAGVPPMVAVSVTCPPVLPLADAASGSMTGGEAEEVPLV